MRQRVPLSRCSAALASIIVLLFSGSISAAPADVFSEQAEYDAAVRKVEEATKLANRDAVAGAAQLETALTELSAFGPLLAEDKVGRDKRTLAELALARAYVVTERQDDAIRVIDNTVRKSLGREVPAGMFGPTFEALYSQRASVLSEQGQGRIKVNCAVSCRVVIEDRPVVDLSDPLYLGSYRVWISATEGDIESLQTTVELIRDGQYEVIDFGRAEAPPVASNVALDKSDSPLVALDTTVDDSTDSISGSPRDRGRQRLMPLWSEIVVLSAGAALAITSGVLFALDEKCKGFDPDYVGNCPKSHEYSILAPSLLGAGAAAAVVGSLTLGIDQVRISQARKGLHVGVTWTLRF